MSRLNDFLTEAGAFFLATADGDQPKLRPLGLHIEADGKVTEVAAEPAEPLDSNGDPIFK